MKKKKIAILASGSGSNAEAIMKWCESSDIAQVVCVGSNIKNAFVLERAAKFNVPSFVVTKKKNEDKDSFDQRLLEKLALFCPDFIVLAGFMKILTSNFLKNYENKVINIHPSLLPDFKGADGYGDAFRADVTESGCTIHYVDEGIDTGKIIAQRKFKKIEGESFEEFKKRGLAIENQFYPEILEKLIKESL